MTAINLTETCDHSNTIDIKVPLFNTGEQVCGITIKCYETLGAWSFKMQEDLPAEVIELFTELCRQNGIRRRLTCAVDLEIGKVCGDYEFLCAPHGAMADGDYFTLEAIYHLIATVFIPYWQQAARQINECDTGKGWTDTWQKAHELLFDADAFTKAVGADREWHDAWMDVNSSYDRRQLIRGNNYRIEVDKPLERFVEKSRCNAVK